MSERNIGTAAEAMSARVLWGAPTDPWSGVQIDSRKVAAGDLFFALAGEQTDGHHFVGAALDSGAAGVVVAQVPSSSSRTGAGLLVNDTFAALHDLTTVVRGDVPQHLVAVTGSAGKTTTKELLGRMLAKRFRTAVSPGNLNNLYGFPLSLLNIPADTEWMVAEMGMSEPGELARVSRLGRPEVAVYTNVGEAHLEGLGSLAAIVDAKAELLEGLKKGGLMVANANDERVLEIAARHRQRGGRVLSYGSHPADVELDELEAVPEGTRFRLSFGSDFIDVRLHLHGAYNAWNFTAAAAAAHHLGVGVDTIAEVGQEVEALAMRGQLESLTSGIVLIDDSYNSNPSALKAAIAAAASVPSKRRLLIAGSMLELGPASAELHRDAGNDAVRRGFNRVVGVGEEAKELAAAAEHHGAEVQWFATADEAAVAVVGDVEDETLVLVKGSRGIGLEVVAAGIRDRFGEEGRRAV